MLVKEGIVFSVVPNPNPIADKNPAPMGLDVL